MRKYFLIYSDGQMTMNHLTDADWFDTYIHCEKILA
jgi:hypothetical protein